MRQIANLHLDIQMQENGKFDVFINQEGDSGCHYKNLTADSIGQLVTGEIETRAGGNKDSLKRIVYVPGSLNNKKYILISEYEGFGIYERKSPNGYLVSQDWLVFNGKTGFICEPYNSLCREELKDAIDRFNETGNFGLSGFMAKAEDHIYGVHPNNKSYHF